MHSVEALFFFPPLRRKLVQGQVDVILAWPCVVNDVLLHYMEEVAEQLDLTLSKSKPHSVIHVCCQCTEPTKSLSIHRKMAWEQFLPVSFCMVALGRVFTSHCTAMLLQKGQEETSLKRRVDSNSNSSCALSSSIISI